MKTLARLVPVAVFAAVAALGLTACSGSAGGQEVIAPVIVDVATLNGSSVEVPLNSSVDITGDDKTYTDWSADIADESVVEFVPGKDDGSAQFNPGLTPKAEGSTDVTLTNSTSHKTVEFTVTVTPKR